MCLKLKHIFVLILLCWGLGCSVFFDLDGDGHTNNADNCPGRSNPQQQDMDGDGVGDVCDPCSEDSTPNCLNGTNVGDVLGCTEADADNYNPEATLDDGGCTVSGCMSSDACNFNENANVDDSSCVYVAEGACDCLGNVLDCSDVCGGNDVQQDCGCGASDTLGMPENACDCLGNIADCNDVCGGVDVEQDCGCGAPGTLAMPMDACDCAGNVLDCNDSCGGTADLDACGICDGDGSSCSGCTNPNASNYDEDAIVDDGSCSLIGCMQDVANNFEEYWEEHDTSCLFGPDELVEPRTFNVSKVQVFDQSGNLIEAQANDWVLFWNNAKTLIVGAAVYNPLFMTRSITVDRSLAVDEVPHIAIYQWENNHYDFADIQGEMCALGTEDLTCNLGDIFLVAGCTDENSPNYNPQATYDDGTCYDDIQISLCPQVGTSELGIYLQGSVNIQGFSVEINLPDGVESMSASGGLAADPLRPFGLAVASGGTVFGARIIEPWLMGDEIETWSLFTSVTLSDVVVNEEEFSLDVEKIAISSDLVQYDVEHFDTCQSG